jgi:hypothetical protein
MLSSLVWSTLFSIPKATGMQLLTSDSEQPRRASPWGDARTSDNDSPRRAGLSIDGLGDLSIDRDQRVGAVARFYL